MKAYYTLPAIYKEPAVYVPCNREIFLLTIDCDDVFFKYVSLLRPGIYKLSITLMNFLL